MPVDSRFKLVEHLLESLSLAECYQEQDPPNPITRAAMQHSVQDLLAALEALNDDPHSRREE